MAHNLQTETGRYKNRGLRGWGWGGILAGVVMAAAVVGLCIRWRLDGDTLALARQKGVIRIGYAVEAPYAFLGPGGEVTGESAEIARIVASRLGISHVDWQLVEFGSLLDGVEARRFDVVAAGMFVTAERAKRVLFSAPTFRVGPGLLVRKGNPYALHSYSDLLQNTNVRIAVLYGAAEEDRLLQHGFPSNRLIRVPDALSGRAAVRSGVADGLLLSAPTIRWMGRHSIAGLTEVAQPFDVSTGELRAWYDSGAFAFRKADRALCRAWNKELARFIGTDEHSNLVGAFGFTSAELPVGVTEHRTAAAP